MSPICFFLWMLKRVSIHLTSASKEKPCTDSLSKSQHIKGTHHIGLVIIVKDINKIQLHKAFKNKFPTNISSTRIITINQK